MPWCVSGGQGTTSGSEFFPSTVGTGGWTQVMQACVTSAFTQWTTSHRTHAVCLSRQVQHCARQTSGHATFSRWLAYRLYECCSPKCSPKLPFFLTASALAISSPIWAKFYLTILFIYISNASEGEEAFLNFALCNSLEFSHYESLSLKMVIINDFLSQLYVPLLMEQDKSC